MPRLPERPDLSWKDDGTPVSRVFDDVYFSMSDGLEETRSVFLKACGLPERWRDCRAFTIAELGFGSGLNFLGTLECWIHSLRQESAWLHFTSVEKYLMSKEDAAKVLCRWPEITPLADSLLSRWPVRTRGLQRIIFPEYRVTLTLYIGDVEDWLTTCSFRADAWFLDGFAPAKNSGMWADALYDKLASHSAQGCMVGTYTVAGAVRRGLAEAGFSVSKQAGFGRKRERLEAIWTGPETAPLSDLYLSHPKAEKFSRVVIVGAGISGACLALGFARRGIPVTILERETGPAKGASGNPYGLVMPRLDAADTPQARLLIQAFLFALRFYMGLGSDAVQGLDAEQIAGNETEEKRFEKLCADPPLDLDWLEAQPHKLIHRQAMAVRPESLVSDIIRKSGADVKFGAIAGSPQAIRDRFGEDSLVIFATGWEADAIPCADIPVIGKMGQVEWGKTGKPKASPASRASGTYAIHTGEDILFGATFEAIEKGAMPAVSAEARAENISAFRALAPDWYDELDETSLNSRASVRATTPDRMPVAGVCFDQEKIRKSLEPLSKGAPVTEEIPYDGRTFILSGLGARGFTFAPLMAELIVCQALDEPLPLANAELEQVSPVRFAIRLVRRGG